MTGTKKKVIAAIEAWFADLRRVHASGGATRERSTYTPLASLLNAVGSTLKPKVFCVGELADQGAGHPDFGLYTGKQVLRGRARSGQVPERGVVEVKSSNVDICIPAVQEQVARYWRRYESVLVTNQREFTLIGSDPVGQEVTLESFRLADSDEDFCRRLENPRGFSRDVGAALAEFLCRVLLQRAALTEPKDLAWLLASYARDGLARVESAVQTPSFDALRSSLEEALGVRFEGESGAKFFRSTLVQTLFYGVFSAWVLWARQTSSHRVRFSWREAVWHLRAPILRALFQQIADPGRLRPLGLVEVLDWTAAALDRVDQGAFFARFTEGEAVPYFYEPFLKAFDPQLRKQLGVWYTPSEVVRYMVARVDRALKDDLGIADGLAAKNVYVLDPCCGTGAYLSEVLRRIAANLENRGAGVLKGVEVKRAALERVFGFEIMPAPFVVAHLQVGLTMQELDAPFATDETERAGVFLTNALTGWESEVRQPLPFPELEDERDRAKRVKQDRPILVILGNPPYNGFTGVAMEEERALSEAYRNTRRVRRPKSRRLGDLYVRFFRMAERRIAEKTGQGVICFISNYSWLDGLTFPGMRERYLEAFDIIRIDCLNGDKFKNGKVTPDGEPDPSIFSTESDPVGIQVGTAITTLVRKTDHTPTNEVAFRDLWGVTKLQELSETKGDTPEVLYDKVVPMLDLGLPFKPMAVSVGWSDWPALPDLFPVSFFGIQTSRDPFVIDVELDRLRSRIAHYFDAEVTHDEIGRCYPSAMKHSTAIRMNSREVREIRLRRGCPNERDFVRYTYRPFDNRWLYWEADAGLIVRPRADYMPHVFDENIWLSAAEHLRKDATQPHACVTRHISSLHLIESGANMFPAWLRHDGLNITGNDQRRRPNLSLRAQSYLSRIGADVEDLFYYVLAVLHDPEYRKANSGALRMDWPRIPLPAWPDGQSVDALETLASMAARGRELAALLDVNVPVPGVTGGAIRPEIASIAIPSTTSGHNMSEDDFVLTGGWGRYGKGQAVIPGAGRVVERTFTLDERARLGDVLPVLGDTTFDIYLNDRTFWRNVPAAVWHYNLGGYQVLKKWLSYREQRVLGRPLTPEEVQHFTHTARRIARTMSVIDSNVSQTVRAFAWR